MSPADAIISSTHSHQNFVRATDPHCPNPRPERAAAVGRGNVGNQGFSVLTAQEEKELPDQVSI